MPDGTEVTKAPEIVTTAVKPKESLKGPGKMNLNPAPRNPKRFSKKVGLLIFGGLGLIGVLIMVGIFTAHAPVGGPAQASANSKLTGADQSGQEMTRKLEAKQREDKLAANAGTSGNVDTSLQPATHSPLPGSEEQPPLVAKRTGVQTLSGGSTYQSPTPGVAPIMNPQKTAEQKEREEMYKLEQQARMAPTSASGSSGRGVMGAVASGTTSLADTLGNIVSRYASSLSPAIQPGGQQGNNDDPNGQNQKDAFLKKAQQNSDSYLKSTRSPQMTPFEIKAGWDIPATLEQGINTDLPGDIKALVRENVYDSATGRYLLIPQGSHVLGTYNSHVTYGQSRVQVIWTRLIYPDGSSITLDGMVGQEAAGAAGFHDKTNNHYVRLASMALLTSAFSAGVSMATNQQSTNQFGAQTNSQLVSQAIAQQMGELGIETTRRNMNIAPTVTIPIGYRFNVRVNKDIAFADPYRPAMR
jgi:type IV secretory pathway VirB10-like protein